MTEKRESLKEIFLGIKEDGTVTEKQQEGPSYEPIDDEAGDQEAVAASVADGLADAIDANDNSPGKKESA
jgi:hypothetical protein